MGSGYPVFKPQLTFRVTCQWTSACKHACEQVHAKCRNEVPACQIVWHSNMCLMPAGISLPGFACARKTSHSSSKITMVLGQFLIEYQRYKADIIFRKGPWQPCKFVECSVLSAAAKIVSLLGNIDFEDGKELVLPLKKWTLASLAKGKAAEVQKMCSHL